MASTSVLAVTSVIVPYSDSSSAHVDQDSSAAELDYSSSSVVAPDLEIIDSDSISC